MQSSNIERWLPVPGYEGSYDVSDKGRVRSVTREVSRSDGTKQKLSGKMLSPGNHRVDGALSGKKVVSLRRDGHAKMYYVHRLVLLAFVGQPPHGTEGCHRDDNGANNDLSNLYWGTRSENLYDMVRNRRHAFANKTHCKWGHEFVPGNTFYTARGNRQCRSCHNERNRARRASTKAYILGGPTPNY